MLDALVSNVPLLLVTVGLLLMAIEAMSPGAYFIVIGVALAGAGLVGLLVPGGLDVLVLAGLTLAIGITATWIYQEFDFYGGKGTAQTTDSSSLAGATGYATEAITPRSGQVKLDDGGFAPTYAARSTGDRIDEGDDVIVLDPGGGNVLTVESLSAIEGDEIDRALARESASDASNGDEDGDGDGDGADESSTDGESAGEPVDDGSEIEGGRADGDREVERSE